MALVQLDTSEVLEPYSIVFQAALRAEAWEPGLQMSLVQSPTCVPLHWVLLQPLPTLSTLQTVALAPRQTMGGVAQPHII